MKRKHNLLFISILLILTSTSLFACSKTSNNSSSSSFITISAKEAKELMDTTEGYVILDVRRPDEYQTSHIENAILISDYEILEKAESILTDKDQVIFVYCRSGRRSKNAARDLVKLGYTNVIDFGGINSWPYGVVTE